MSKRNQPEDSGSTESLENITSESESEQNYSDEIDEPEPEQEFPQRGRPNKNRYIQSVPNPNNMPYNNISLQNHMNIPNPTNNMLYRNINVQRPPYNPGMPPNYRNMPFPSNLGASNPSYIGNMPQYGNQPYNPNMMRNGHPMGYPPNSYGYPYGPQYNQAHNTLFYKRNPTISYGRPYSNPYMNMPQPNPMYNPQANPHYSNPHYYNPQYTNMPYNPGYSMIKRQPPNMAQTNRFTPPLPPRVDREKRREKEYKKRKREEDDLDQPLDIIESEELEETEIDTNEKLLFCKNNYFFVKTRGFSYLHCIWVRKEDIQKTRAGSIKVKRFLSSNKNISLIKNVETKKKGVHSKIINESDEQKRNIATRTDATNIQTDSEHLEKKTKAHLDNQQGVLQHTNLNNINQNNNLNNSLTNNLNNQNNNLNNQTNNNLNNQHINQNIHNQNNQNISVQLNVKNIDDLIQIQNEELIEPLLNRLNERPIQQTIQDDFGGIPPFDPEYIKIDRIISVDKQYLVKWKNIPYELSTLEFPEDLKELVGFDEESEAFRRRNVKRKCKYPIDWRPPKESLNITNDFKNQNSLRDYQLEGLNWLLNRWFYRQGCIMADEMGLGKTIQSVCFVNKLFETGYHFPVLIVAPLSTLIHWEREFKNWTDLRVLLYHGNNIARELIHDYEFDNNGLLFDVLITTYEMVMSGIKHLDISFGVGIFDEAHRLKNSHSKAFQILMTLQFNHKVLLSGTPLQNNLTELWSLLHFLDPIKNESLNYFLESYKLEKSEDVDRLKTLLKPVMLRRMKDDVEKIPIKEETIVEVELTLIQKQFYRAILEKNMSIFESSTPNLLNIMMELRKCCIHPYLVRGAEEKILHDYKLKKKIDHIKQKKRKDGDETGSNSRLASGRASPIQYKSNQAGYTEDSFIPEETQNMVPCENRAINDISDKNNIELGDLSEEAPWSRKVYSEELTIDEYYKILIQSSGKLVLLDKLLEKLKGQHKVLVFSQMTRCLDLLADYLNYKKYKFERIDGAVRGDCRQAAIDRFSKHDSESFVFLLCTRAGGMGINLTSADTCVIFDSDWNPQNDLQAQARCHRIGQTKNVKIYRLITRNTYEREMFDKAGLKLGLDQAILQKNIKGVKKKEYIESLLKKGAWGVLMENDNEAQKFCEEDIDIMLKRRTQVIKHEEGQNVFSRASFQVEEEFDDPDFWRNLISRKKNAENEQKIKKIIRKIGREEKTNYKEIDHILSTTNDEMLKIFLTIYRKGLGAMFDDVQDLKKKITFIMRKCFDLVHDKDKELFKFHLEAYFVKSPTLQTKSEQDDKIKKDSPSEHGTDQYVLDHPIVKKLAERFLLRLQTVNILKYLYKLDSLELMKGVSLDEDRRIINWVISNGYDNWPTGVGEKKSLFKGKDRNDLNTRVRKIILSLNKMTENQKEREHEHEIDNLIMNYGRVTALNETDLAENIEEITKKVEIATTQKRKRSLYGNLNKRIGLIDALQFLEIGEIKRTTGLPRNWKIENDEQLVLLVRSKGISNTGKDLKLTDEVVVRRLEALVSHQTEME